jgi:hypothetical protein
MDFLDLFSNGPVPRRVNRVARLGSTVDRGGADKRPWRCLVGAWRMGARARWCSPAVAEEDELGEAVP